MKIKPLVFFLFAGTSIVYGQQVLYVPNGTSGVQPTNSGNQNIGIGTPAPADQFEIVSGYRKIGFNTIISGVTNGGVLSLSRGDDGAKTMFIGSSAAPQDDNVIFSTGGSTELRFVSGGGPYATGGFGFYNTTSIQTAFASTRPTPAMRIDGNGKVGIGTATPDHILQIQGSNNPTFAIGKLNEETAGKSTLAFYAGAGAYKNGFIVNYIKNASSDRLGFVDGGLVEILSLKNGGNVGIGITDPAFKLDVQGSGARIRNIGTSSGDYTTFRVQGPDYTHGLEIDFFGNNNISSDLNWSYGGGAGSVAIVNVNSKPLTFGTNNQGRMIIDASGNVGIGTFAPNQKLTVNGTIYGREVKVDLNVPGPDYVFEKDYKLPSLGEVEKYIAKNKHLPEVPSAEEMETNGINLGEMNMLLLKKVEELTLYVIELKKENEQIKNQLKEKK